MRNASYYMNTTELEKWYPYKDGTEKIFSSCQVYVNGSEVPEACQEFVFDHSTFGSTAVIEVEYLLFIQIFCIFYLHFPKYLRALTVIS